MAKQNSDEQRKAYEAALLKAEALLKTQKDINNATDNAKEIWNDISTALVKISGADWFKQVPKTTEDLSEAAEQMTKINEELDEASGILNTKLNKSLKTTRNELSDLSKIKLEFGASDLIKNFNQAGLSAQDLADILSKKTGKEIKDISKITEKEWLEHMKDINDEFDTFSKDLKELDEKELKSFVDKMEQSLENQKDMNKQLQSLGVEYEGLKNISSEHLKTELLRAIQNKDIAGFIKKHGMEGRNALTVSKLLSKEEMSQVDLMSQQVEQAAKFKKEMNESSKSVFSLGEGMAKMAKNLRTAIVGTVMGFDQAISTAQKNTGILFKENTQAMSDLTTQTAEFGMSVEDTTALMGGLSDKLATTDFGVLSKAAGDFKAIQSSVGVSMENITTIASEMMIMGQSSEQVREAFNKTNKEAKMLGLNSKRVLQQIEKNIDKMRKFGFEGGIESLRDMALEAERLRIDMDEIFNVAKRARSIQGAMEMAAELQLAGGSFAQINPMDLLSAARKGPKELSNILTSMGGDVGHWNEEMNRFEFDPVDVDRLQMVADATGMSLDSIQKSLMKRAEDNKKMELFPSSMMAIDDKDKDFLMTLGDIGEDGNLQIKGEFEDLAKKAGISDLSMITPQQLGDLKKLKEQETKDLEEQAKQNASLKEAFDRFVKSFMQIFTVFEPVLIWLADVLGEVGRIFGAMPNWGKKLVGGLLIAFALFGGHIKMFGGLVGKMGGMLKGLGKGAVGIAKKITGMGGGSLGAGPGKAISDKASAIQKNTPKGGGGLVGFAKSLQKASKEAAKISMKGILKFAGAMLIIGGALVAFTVVLAKFGGDASLGQLLTAGVSLIILGGSMILFSKLSNSIDMKGLLMFSAAMFLVGAALIPFGFAAQMLSDIDLLNVLAALGILTLVIIGLALLGSMLMGPQIIGLLIGIGVLIAVSAGLLIFGAAMLLAANAFEKISAINWAGFAEMGPALMSAVPGLIGFSLAAMAFLNPLALLGFMVMVGVLTQLAAIAVPLGEGFSQAADGMEKFANNVSALNEAVASLDMDRLEDMAELAEGLQGVAQLGNIANALSKAQSGGGGSQGGVKTVKHEVNIKLNGREVKQMILEDTDQQS